MAKLKVQAIKEADPNKDDIRDLDRPTHTPWPLTEANLAEACRAVQDNNEESLVLQCSTLQNHFAKPFTLPLVMLTSFPGSGTTWMRYLLEGTTGVFTGAFAPVRFDNLT